MFGPNVRTLASDATHYFHHREPAYRALLAETTRLFRELFLLPEDEWSVLFVTGSGTVVNEMVLWSLTGARIRVHSDTGEFTSRLRGLAQAHGKLKRAAFPHYAMVTYETAESRYVAVEWPRGPSYGEGVRFADCVSSFPYYGRPPGCDVWTTVSSKQLGALPVLGIVVVRRSAWRWFIKAERSYSYLNLARWRAAAEEREESPHTPSMALLHDLNERLQGFDPVAAARVIARRRALLEGIAPEGAVVGAGPVFTVAEFALSAALAERWRLYCPKISGRRQLFLYSGTDDQYEQFMVEWRKELLR